MCSRIEKQSDIFIFKKSDFKTSKSDLIDLLFFFTLIWSFWIEYLLPIALLLSERKYLEHLEMRQQNSIILILLLNKNNVFSVSQTVCPYVFTWNNVSMFCIQLIGLLIIKEQLTAITKQRVLPSYGFNFYWHKNHPDLIVWGSGT